MDVKRLVLLAALMVCGLAGAQEPDGFQRRLERYKAMTARRRAELRVRFEDFRGLSDDERTRVRQRYDQLARTDRKEQERITRNIKRLRRMSPQKRAQLRRRQRKLAKAMERLRADMSPKERERIAGLAPRERRAALRVLLRERIIEKSLAPLPAQERKRIEGKLRRTRDSGKQLELARKARGAFKKARQSVDELMRGHRARFAPILARSRRGQDTPDQLLGRVEEIVRQLRPAWNASQVSFAARMILDRIDRLPGGNRPGAGDRKRPTPGERKRPGAGERKRGG